MKSGIYRRKLIMGGLATNWQEQALRDAMVSNIQLNVSGGSKTG